jgi:hypothetical protein
MRAVAFGSLTVRMSCGFGSLSIGYRARGRFVLLPPPSSKRSRSRPSRTRSSARAPPAESRASTRGWCSLTKPCVWTSRFQRVAAYEEVALGFSPLSGRAVRDGLALALVPDRQTRLHAMTSIAVTRMAHPPCAGSASQPPLRGTHSALERQRSRAARVAGTRLTRVSKLATQRMQVFCVWLRDVSPRLTQAV